MTIREQLAVAVATRQEIEFSDAFDSLERASLLKRIDRTIDEIETRIAERKRAK